MPARTARPSWRYDAGALGIVLSFVLVAAYGLGTTPTVHDDEAWIAEPGLTFWRHGHLGSELLRGFAGSERQYYHLTPLYPVLAGLVLELAGTGLTQARSVSVALGAVAILGTYLAGRRLLSPPRGLLASVILAFWPVASLGPFDRSGIPLLDLSRIVRYDIGVPAFGVLALAVAAPLWTRPRESLRSQGRVRAFVAGLLCAAATSSHVYGAAWFVVLESVTLAVLTRSAGGLLAATAGGWLVGLLPWVAWVVAGWPLARAQAGPSAYHFASLSVPGIAASVASEWRRYAPLAQAFLQPSVAAWTWAGGIGLALWRLARPAWKRDASAIVLVGAVAVHAVLFAALLGTKNFRYLASAWPIFALLAAEGLASAWRSRHARAGRIAIVGLVIVATLTGALAVRRLFREADSSTPYAEACRMLARHVPAGARVLALQHYWFGLAGHVSAYRSLLVPIYRSDPRWNEGGVTFAAAADALGASVLIVDPVLSTFLAEAAPPSHDFHGLADDIRRYVRDGWRLRSTVHAGRYGRFEIYERRGVE